ncbi:unnamed protein product [Boreogadus saida]
MAAGAKLRGKKRISLSVTVVHLRAQPGRVQPCHTAEGQGLQSTMDEEREEGGPTSKTTLSGEHGRRSKAKR